MQYYLLGLGSNIRPDQNLPQALSKLANLGEIIMQSDSIETVTVGHTFHAPFKNQLVIFQCAQAQQQLKKELLNIESQLGREAKTPARREKDRTIDIDILFNADNPLSCLNAPLKDSYDQQVKQHWQTQLNK